MNYYYIIESKNHATSVCICMKKNSKFITEK